ncbi:uncharacterized protein LOC131251575 [Magnolia sinica]|uniref:uncharacterized protein LOC131251575 n=1 Tax=Magnolia sinica TaxID=86752 RepID=UPI002657C1B3|nr:uncharacterized protein LOC131251575 [Magnolia sinica]
MAKESIDQQALVKAAAWAWYQHGSGCDGRRVHEFNLSRTHQAPRPSRYKRETMRDVAHRPADSSSQSSHTPKRFSPASLSPSHTNMSLLDSYEIERISRQLDQILESTNACFRRAYVIVNGRDRPRGGTSSARDMAGGKVGGIWARHATGICSSRGSVVEARVLDRGPSRKSGSTVRLVHCHP